MKSCCSTISYCFVDDVAKSILPFWNKQTPEFRHRGHCTFCLSYRNSFVVQAMASRKPADSKRSKISKAEDAEVPALGINKLFYIVTSVKFAFCRHTVLFYIIHIHKCIFLTIHYLQ